MAEDPPSSGNGSPLVILVVVAALAFFVPAVGEFVFQWIPAAMSVATGVEMPGDVRYLSQSEPEKEVMVMLQPLPSRSLVAQVTSAFDTGAQYDPTLPSVARGISVWWNMLIPISIFASLLLLVGIVYSVMRLIRIRERERAAWSVAEHPIAANDTTKAQLRWQKVFEHANTENPNDWRHAIIEADIMLDELLEVQGYHGDTVGDKMKQVERSDFNTIDLAWEAHKVRNRIAHEGSEHDLNAREVRRVISLYEQVLREFHFI